MKRGEFDISAYSCPTPQSARRLMEAERDWMDSWEASIADKAAVSGLSWLQNRRTQSPLIQIEIDSTMLRVTLLSFRS
jgi:hypothetical protein